MKMSNDWYVVVSKRWGTVEFVVKGYKNAYDQKSYVETMNRGKRTYFVRKVTDKTLKTALERYYEVE